MTKELTIGEKIRQLRIAKGLSVPAFAAKYNLNKANLYKWESGTKPSHHEDYIELEKILFSENNKTKNMANEEEQEYKSKNKDVKSKDLHGTDKTMETVYSLAESNKTLVDSHKLLVETNANLVGMIKVMSKTTGSVAQDIQKDVYAKLDNLLEAIAEVASGKKYHSKQEALATLGKNFYESTGS